MKTALEQLEDACNIQDTDAIIGLLANHFIKDFDKDDNPIFKEEALNVLIQHQDTLTVLLDHPLADTNVVRQVFLEACNSNHTGAVGLLQWDERIKNSVNNGLMLACLGDHIEVVNQLLENQAIDINGMLSSFIFAQNPDIHKLLIQDARMTVDGLTMLCDNAYKMNRPDLMMPLAVAGAVLPEADETILIIFDKADINPKTNTLYISDPMFHVAKVKEDDNCIKVFDYVLGADDLEISIITATCEAFFVKAVENKFGFTPLPTEAQKEVFHIEAVGLCNHLHNQYSKTEENKYTSKNSPAVILLKPEKFSLQAFAFDAVVNHLANSAVVNEKSNQSHVERQQEKLGKTIVDSITKGQDKGR